MRNVPWLACVAAAAGVVGLCGYFSSRAPAPADPTTRPPALLALDSVPVVELTYHAPTTTVSAFPTSAEPPLADGSIHDPHVVTANYTATPNAEPPCCEWLGVVLSKSCCWGDYLRAWLAGPVVPCEPQPADDSDF